MRAHTDQMGNRLGNAFEKSPIWDGLYHNAWSESVIGTLKNEMLQGGRFIDQTDAQIELFAYIEGYYNTTRKHSALNYQSPLQFETQKQSLN